MKEKSVRRIVCFKLIPRQKIENLNNLLKEQNNKKILPQHSLAYAPLAYDPVINIKHQ